MDWRRPDGSLDVAAFMAHALSLYGDPADRYSVDADTVFLSIVTRPAFHDQAACSGQGTRVFFVRKGASSAPARAVCAECPVRTECLAAAVTGHEVGIWAGSTAQQRDGMRRAATGAA